MNGATAPVYERSHNISNTANMSEQYIYSPYMDRGGTKIANTVILKKTSWIFGTSDEKTVLDVIGSYLMYD